MRPVRAIVSLLVIVLAGACRPSAPSGAVNAHALFGATCAKCHGEEGHADTPQGQLVGAKDLTRDEARKMSDIEIAHQIVVGKGKMPAFGEAFSDAEVTGLVAEVRKLQKK